MTRTLYGFVSTIEEAHLLLKNDVKLIQLRNKNLPDEELLDLAKQMVLLTHKYKDAHLIINDNIDIAIKANAYGVHLGQDDGDIPYLCKSNRKKLVIGVSVDNVEEAIEAETWGAHYIGAGAVFGSVTKPEAPKMGLDMLRDICHSVHIPVSAIGGINLSHLNSVLNTGAQYICVISDIYKATNIESQISEYLKGIRRYHESL